MKRKGILLTHNDLELACVILTSKPLVSGGEEVLAYCQNRLVKGLLSEIDNTLVTEISVEVHYCIIPELDNELLVNSIE